MLSISNHFFIPYLLWQEILLNIWIRFSFLNTAGSRICRKGGTGERALNMSHYPHVVHKITNCHDYSRRFVVEACDDWMYAYITGTMIHIRLCTWLWVRCLWYCESEQNLRANCAACVCWSDCFERGWAIWILVSWRPDPTTGTPYQAS